MESSQECGYKKNDSGKKVNDNWLCKDGTAKKGGDDKKDDKKDKVATIRGCLDKNALNYNSNANTEFGFAEGPNPGCEYEYDGTEESCVDSNIWRAQKTGAKKFHGCKWIASDPDSYCDKLGYDKTIDEKILASEGCPVACGSCPDILGCTDATASNFNPAATLDDDSCILPVLGCTDPSALNHDDLATEDDGSCEYAPKVNPGCTDPVATNYNDEANYDDGSCLYPIKGCMDKNASNYNKKAVESDDSCIFPIEGCMDPSALNFDPNATKDKGCIPRKEGCMDKNALNYKKNATIDDGSCEYPLLDCNDESALNYNPDATENDGSCLYPIPGCLDVKAKNYNADATIDNGSCEYPIKGCTYSSAVNYNAAAEEDDGSCINAPDECPEWEGCPKTAKQLRWVQKLSHYLR
jgi:hypothetical protein